ncbi:MAG: hypothetical protein OJF49_003004 [Ktedonobacterales bacterium]|jgi:ABC-type lipoprotein release transport system permease subunit|nr:MAG: hypothetical protein OJF49_003004 [Ktedonobacterales bacterium]
MGVKTISEEAPPARELPLSAGARGRPWRSRFSPLSPVRLAGLRLRRSWRLLLAAGAGILVAVVLICTVPLYTTLVTNVQVRHVLSTAPVTDFNIEGQVSLTASDPAAITDVTLAATASGDTLSSFVTHTNSYYELQTSFIPTAVSTKGEKLPESAISQPLAFDYAQALPHMTLLAGRLPQDTAAGQLPEVLVTSKMGLKPGDVLTLNAATGALPPPDCMPLRAITGKVALKARVVGVWFPKNTSDPFWNGRSYDSITVPAANPDCPPPPVNYPLLFSPTTFAQMFIPPQPTNPTATPVIRTPIMLHYLYYPDLSKITATNIGDLASALATFKQQFDAILLLEIRSLHPLATIQSVTVGTSLDRLIAGLQAQLSALTQPLYIVVAQVVGLALLFVVAMAGLLVEDQAGEIATLKSRGSSTLQLLLNFALQGLPLAAIAALAGPILAVALSLLIVRLFVPGAATLGSNAFNGGSLAQTVSPAMVSRPALVGALLGAATLIVAAWRASRLDVLAFRREQGRARAVPFWKRYYLDVVLALLCAAGYLELGQFGGLNVRSQLGQQQVGADPVQLAAPGLLLIAGALLVLRIFPWAASFGAHLIGRGRGATGMLAFAQVARASAQFTRLTLLLTLAVGLGLFALTFQSSLGANAADKAQFLIGADQRDLLVGQLTIPTLALQPQFAALPGVRAAMPAYRSQANVSVGSPVGLLAVDTKTFAQVAYWQPSYASQPVSALMQAMRSHLQGRAAGDKQHPIWALVDSSYASAAYLHPGDLFTLNPAEASDTSVRVYFVVGGIINYIPTMADTHVTGNILVDQGDYLAALLNPDLTNAQVQGPNEYWLRTTASASDTAQRAHAMQSAFLPVQTVLDRQSIQDQLQTEPLNAGMSGLLLAGALIAALLAVLGSLIQAGVSARQRVTQFAILRTLGAGRPQLVGILLLQQVIVYLFGLVGGTLLGLVLSTATLPFLQFITAVASAASLRVPPYTLVLNPQTMVLFYAALLLAFLLALALAARRALRVGLGKALRIGED